MSLRFVMVPAGVGMSFVSAGALAQAIPPGCFISPGTTVVTCPTTSTYAEVSPRYGSPNSAQFQGLSVGLDLADIQAEGADRSEPEGDADTIGGALTYWGVTHQQGERFEARYQHQSRISEGSRARLLIDIPIDILRANKMGSKASGFGGGTAALGTVSVGVEVPVQPNWLVTPRLAYGNVQAGDFFGGDGEIVTVSVTSRYKFPQVGRGDLVLGNMVAYSRTVDTFLSKQPFYGKTENFLFRNGLAYQMPLKIRMFGRQASLRASYVFTLSTKDKVSYEQIHELGVNIGVRTREAEQKNGFEQLRIGLLYTHSKNQFMSNFDYDSITTTVGYRF